MSKPSPQLQAEWNKKLKDSGFEDAEQSDGHLKAWHDTRFRVFYTPEEAEARIEYYRLAGQLLHDHSFTNERERLIWQGHAEGKSWKEIIRLLKAKNMHGYQDVVTKTIVKLRKEMLTKCKKTKP